VRESENDPTAMVRCELCAQPTWLNPADLTRHMDEHGYDLREEIAGAEIVDLTGEPT
jgi:ferritin-like protein